MHAALLNPSKHIKGAAFGHDGIPKEPTYTIKRIGLEELEREDETKEDKGIIHFQEIDKSWVANVINVKALIAMFGLETDDWIGKRVTLWFDENVRAFGEKTGGIRVRGSPDIAGPVSYMFKTMKSKKRQITLIKTGGAAPAGRQQQRQAAPATPTIWSRIQTMADEYGFTRGEKDAALIELVKKTTNGKPGRELNEDDFTAVEAAMSQALGAGSGPADGAAPADPAVQEAIPF